MVFSGLQSVPAQGDGGSDISRRAQGLTVEKIVLQTVCSRVKDTNPMLPESWKVQGSGRNPKERRTHIN